jgi:hypothetical protein
MIINNKLLIITDIDIQIKTFLKNISDTNIYFINKNDNYNNRIITNLSQKQIDFLQININFSSQCLTKINTKLKNKNPNLDINIWKICVFSEMFFNLPFTLDDIIFIPISYLNSSLNTNNNILFSKTLIHEKIHLLQRYNQHIWNDYIINNTKWIIVDKTPVYNSSLINNNKIIYNPDTYYLKNIFVYSNNNKYYYGQMFLNSNNQIKNIWYEYTTFGNLFPVNVQVTNYEHPYEELAYVLSNELII